MYKIEAMSRDRSTAAWLTRVQHDLIKRLLWSARDFRELGKRPAPGELIATYVDDDGEPIDALALWAHLREDAPNELDLAAFENALGRSLAAAQRNDLDGVLAIERDFERLCSPPD
jgi:hypothetical protein